MLQPDYTNIITQLQALKTQGFRLIRSKGDHCKLNPQKDYKSAKIPIDENYTSPDYQEPSLDQCFEWIEQGGWMSFMLPKNTIAIDIENHYAIAQIEDMIQQKGIRPGIHKTRNGYHYLFSTNENDLKAHTEMLVKCGLTVTYRVGGKSLLILPPSDPDQRKWVQWIPIKELPGLPPEMLPINKKSKPEIINALCYQVGYCYKNGLLSGNDDIDMAFMGYLIQELTLSKDAVLTAFKTVFQQEYDEDRTQDIYERFTAKVQNKELVKGAGTFIQVIKDKALYHITTLLDILKPYKKSDTFIVSKKTLYHYALKLENLEIADNWLINKFLLPNTLNMFFGKPGSGKSYLSLTIALYLLQTNSIDAIIYLDGDNSKLALKKRKLGELIQTLPLEKFIYIPAFNVDNETTLLTCLKDQLNSNRTKKHLIVIDSIRNFMTGKDVNSDKDTGEFMKFAKQIRDMDYNTIFLLHHLNKQGTIKNSTTFLDYCDTAFRIELEEQESKEGCLKIALSKEKDRNGEILNKLTTYVGYNRYELKITDDYYSEKYNQTIDCIISIIKQSPDITQKTLKEIVKSRINIGEHDLRNLLERFTGKLWECIVGGKNTKLYKVIPSKNENQNSNIIISWIL